MRGLKADSTRKTSSTSPATTSTNALRVTYVSGNVTLVKSIQQYDAQDRCLAPANFTWADAGSASFSNVNWGAHGYPNDKTFTGDFNGGGKAPSAYLM